MAVDTETFVRRVEEGKVNISEEEAKRIIKNRIEKALLTSWTASQEILFRINGSNLGEIRNKGKDSHYLEREVLQRIGLDIMTQYGLDLTKFELDKFESQWPGGTVMSEFQDYPSQKHESLYFRRRLEYKESQKGNPLEVKWEVIFSPNRQ